MNEEFEDMEDKLTSAEMEIKIAKEWKEESEAKKTLLQDSYTAAKHLYDKNKKNGNRPHSDYVYSQPYFNIIGGFNDPFLVVARSKANEASNDPDKTYIDPQFDSKDIGEDDEIRLVQFIKLPKDWKEHKIHQIKD